MVNVDFNELSVVDLQIINAFTGITFEISNGRVTGISLSEED